MWRAIFKNSSDGELDRIESETEAELKEELIERIKSWSLADGDSVKIEERV